ncbi:uncharacterized protein BKA78DRAFT_314262 [Phyllosticta capitalensis]|uniref:uncharacterized protein n=1 Tax=Phyllosticta capitalensis TaxID=121624 RepID=UPI00312E8E98
MEHSQPGRRSHIPSCRSCSNPREDCSYVCHVLLYSHCCRPSGCGIAFVCLCLADILQEIYGRRSRLVEDALATPRLHPTIGRHGWHQNLRRDSRAHFQSQRSKSSSVRPIYIPWSSKTATGRSWELQRHHRGGVASFPPCIFQSAASAPWTVSLV